MQPALAMYVLYQDPTDFPGNFVLRRWLGVKPDPIPMAVTTNLALARNVIPDYCTPIGRFQDDDPKILEVWL